VCLICLKLVSLGTPIKHTIKLSNCRGEIRTPLYLIAKECNKTLTGKLPLLTRHTTSLIIAVISKIIHIVKKELTRCTVPFRLKILLDLSMNSTANPWNSAIII
tara:strand:+ start:1591 stop:1902 length:312 start_codon:yes stop_codon:yes gene_type:complete